MKTMTLSKVVWVLKHNPIVTPGERIRNAVAYMKQNYCSGE